MRLRGGFKSHVADSHCFFQDSSPSLGASPFFHFEIISLAFVLFPQSILVNAFGIPFLYHTAVEKTLRIVLPYWLKCKCVLGAAFNQLQPDSTPCILRLHKQSWTFPRLDLFFLTLIALFTLSLTSGKTLLFTLVCKNTVYLLSNAASSIKHAQTPPEVYVFHVYKDHVCSHIYVYTAYIIYLPCFNLYKITSFSNVFINIIINAYLLSWKDNYAAFLKKI